jgi:hypothetical protein
MAVDCGADDVRAAKIRAMGASLGELHFALWNEVTWLHLKWKDYRALFGESLETIDLLNEAAPAFFSYLQNVLWEDVLLHLCRITDPQKTSGHANLTISLLPPLISDIAIRNKSESLVKVANDKTAFARDWRNRWLAHRELPDFSGKALRPLAAASRQHVEEALTSIREVMNCIEQHYQGSPVHYEYSIEALGGVNALLSVLEKGLKDRRAIRSGSPGGPGKIG